VLCEAGCVTANNTNSCDLHKGFQLDDSVPTSSMNNGNDFVDG
jgi:hypothetical protein